jgi:Fungal trichothecene efflux pump (TRI12)
MTSISWNPAGTCYAWSRGRPIDWRRSDRVCILEMVCVSLPSHLLLDPTNPVQIGFLINLPCGAVVALFLVLIPIPDMGIASEKKTVVARLRRLDLIGFALFAPTMLMIIFALQWGGVNYAWNSATIIGLFCGAGGNFIVFVAWQYYMGNEAMIPLGLIKRRVIWSSCINMGFLVACTMVIVYYLPIYFQAVRDASPTQSGVDMLPQILSNMVFTIATGILGMSRICR